MEESKNVGKQDEMRGDDRRDTGEKRKGEDKIRYNRGENEKRKQD